jgi:hypothetical protein
VPMASASSFRVSVITSPSGPELPMHGRYSGSETSVIVSAARR